MTLANGRVCEQTECKQTESDRERDPCKLQFLSNILEMLGKSVHFVLILWQLVFVSLKQLLIRLNLDANTANHDSTDLYFYHTLSVCLSIGNVTGGFSTQSGLQTLWIREESLGSDLPHCNSLASCGTKRLWTSAAVLVQRQHLHALTSNKQRTLSLLEGCALSECRLVTYILLWQCLQEGRALCWDVTVVCPKASP